MCAEPDQRRRQAATIFRSLRVAEVVEIVRNPQGQGSSVRVNEDLQSDFSLHQSLSLYLVEAAAVLPPLEEHYSYIKEEYITPIDVVLRETKTLRTFVGNGRLVFAIGGDIPKP